MADDLAVRPGPAPAELHRRIPDGEDPEQAPQPVLAAALVTPSQLPATVERLVGRDAVLAEIGAALTGTLTGMLAGTRRLAPVVLALPGRAR